MSLVKDVTEVDRPRGECQMTGETEAGVMHLQAKGCQKARGEVGTGSSPASERAWPSRLLDFILLASRSETINFCCLRHPACGTLFWQPQETNILYQLEEVICNCSLLKDLSRMDSRFWQMSVLYLLNGAYGFLCVLLICLTSIGLTVLISIVNQILYS